MSNIAAMGTVAKQSAELNQNSRSWQLSRYMLCHKQGASVSLFTEILLINLDIIKEIGFWTLSIVRIFNRLNSLLKILDISIHFNMHNGFEN
jgi:hypothetical protein